MNTALTSNYERRDHCYPILKARYAILMVALAAQGYDPNHYAGLEPSCDGHLPEMEERKEEWVELYLEALSLKIDLATLPDVTSCELITAAPVAKVIGTYATLTTALAGANNDLKFTSKNIGTIGNIISIQYLNPAANSQALSVSVIGGLIRVSLATDGGGAITSTATLIKAAITASAQANSLVSSALVSGNTGAGVVIAMAATNLAGGTN